MIQSDRHKLGPPPQRGVVTLDASMGRRSCERRGKEEGRDSFPLLRGLLASIMGD